jgi:hypothetical protein
VLDDLERIVPVIAFKFDEGHAASTAPLKWKCARHWTTPRTGCDLTQEQLLSAD